MLWIGGGGEKRYARRPRLRMTILLPLAITLYLSMPTQNFPLEISAAIGSVSAEYVVPPNAKYMMTLAHGAGAGMDHSFMQMLAEALADLDIATLRFNFPFMENKKGRPDLPAVAHKTIEAAIKEAQESYASLPLFIAGKSFGGRMSSQYLALHPESKVKGIIFYGFPLHSPKKPSTDRAEHLKEVKQPMLFLQGTRDELAEWTLIDQVCNAIPTAQLIKIEGADHAFKKGKENLVPLLANATIGWMGEIK
jgi:uncharacterized protein